MDKLLIGIDLSMDSTGMCFRYKGQNRYLSIFNKRKFSVKKQPIEELLDDDKIDEKKRDVMRSVLNISNVDVAFIEKESIPTVKKVGLVDWQRKHMEVANAQSKQIFDILVDYLKKHYARVAFEDIFINLENYSYGSVTDNLIQVVELTCLLKKKILGELVDYHQWYIVPGPTIKMFAGKGNFDKYDMFNAFVTNAKGDPNVEQGDEFRDTLMEDPSMYWKVAKKKKKEFNDVIAPIPDLVDAYYMALFLEQKYLA